MIRTLFFAAASVLLVGVLFAEDEKPEAKPDVVKGQDAQPVKKESQEGLKKGDPEIKSDVVKGDVAQGKNSEPVMKDKGATLKGDFGIKGDSVKGKTPDGGKKQGKEGFKKGDRDAKKMAAEKGSKKEGKPSKWGQKGTLNKIGVESGVVKFSVDGKDYEFAVTNNTAAVVTTQERDGKQVVMGISLVNFSEEAKKGSDKSEQLKQGGKKGSDGKPIEMIYKKPTEPSPE